MYVVITHAFTQHRFIDVWVSLILGSTDLKDLRYNPHN